jgi:hypothetical protein
MAADKADAESTDSLLRAKQREFLETFLKKGTEFTEELIRENERLRFRVAELEAGASGGTLEGGSSAHLLRDLAARIEALEAERDDLLRRFRRASDESAAVERRYLDIENENTRLASLYVAANQLHASLDLREVVQVIHEVLLNFIGAKTFMLLLRDESSATLAPLSREGVPDELTVPGDRGVVAAVLRDGVPRLDGPLHGAAVDPFAPSICVPLSFGGRHIGAVAIWEFLQQKDSLSDVDAELLRLIGNHAAAAILSARLYAQAGAPTLNAAACVEQLAKG